MDKYPDATFTVDDHKLADFMFALPRENQEMLLANLRWLARQGDQAALRSYPFVTSITLGKSSR